IATVAVESDGGHVDQDARMWIELRHRTREQISRNDAAVDELLLPFRRPAALAGVLTAQVDDDPYTFQRLDVDDAVRRIPLDVVVPRVFTSTDPNDRVTHALQMPGES